MSDDQTQETPPSARATWPLWLKLLLSASLAFNLLVAGVVLGVWWRGGDHLRSGLDGPRGAAALIFALEKPDRRAFWRDMRAARQQIGRQRADLNDILNMIRADPPDMSGLARIVSEQAERGHEIQSRMRAAWLARIETMTAQERASYADRLERVWREGSHRNRP